MASRNKTTALLKIASIVLSFFAFVAILIAANLIASLKGDPYLSFFEKLQPQFYIKTLFILLISSLLYTPLSYGISDFFVQSAQGDPQFSDLFYMFTKPLLLVKAILLRISVWFVRGFYQLAVLFAGMVLETVICLLHLTFLGENIMDLSVDDLQRLISEILEYNSFMWLTVILWICVLAVLAVTYLSFMLCKYALLQYEELSVFESIQIGRLAVRGRFFALCFCLLQKYTYYILLVGSFGALAKVLESHKKEPFSMLAIRWVEQGRTLYFKKKARKALDK